MPQYRVYVRRFTDAPPKQPTMRYPIINNNDDERTQPSPNFSVKRTPLFCTNAKSERTYRLCRYRYGWPSNGWQIVSPLSLLLLLLLLKLVCNNVDDPRDGARNDTAVSSFTWSLRRCVGWSVASGYWSQTVEKVTASGHLPACGGQSWNSFSDWAGSSLCPMKQLSKWTIRVISNRSSNSSSLLVQIGESSIEESRVYSSSSIALMLLAGNCLLSDVTESRSVPVCAVVHIYIYCKHKKGWWPICAFWPAACFNLLLIAEWYHAE